MSGKQKLTAERGEEALRLLHYAKKGNTPQSANVAC